MLKHLEINYITLIVIFRWFLKSQIVSLKVVRFHHLQVLTLYLNNFNLTA